MTDPDLTHARALYQVPAAPLVRDVIALLEQWGAQPMPVGTQEGNFFDEYVEEDLVVHQVGIADPVFIAEHLTEAEAAMLAFSEECEDDDFDDDFDDDEPDAGDPEWDVMAAALSERRLLVVVIERDRENSLRVGNFRVHGMGQWVREALWAATGVVPRDPAMAQSDLYRQAVVAAHPDRWDRPVRHYDRLGRFWPRYVRLMRPHWRRTRRRHLVNQDGSH